MNFFTEKQLYCILTISLCVFLVYLSKYLSWQDLSFIAFPPSGGEKEIPPRFVVEIEGEVKSPWIYCFSHKVSVRDALERAGGVRDGFEFAEDRSDVELLHGTKITVTGHPSSLTIDQMAPHARLLYFIPIDVNTAGVEDLVVVPGIGEKTAETIIEYRRRYGPYSDLEELKKVRGIACTAT